MKERGKLIDNTVVTTVMSNFGLYKAFDAAGIDYEKTKVGDKYVYECMSQNGYRLGGEQFHQNHYHKHLHLMITTLLGNMTQPVRNGIM